VSADARVRPSFRVGAGERSRRHDLPGFPGSVPRWRQRVENWSGHLVVDDVWTCAPRTIPEVLLVADWAAANGYRLRPRGASHNFSPLALTGAEAPQDRVVVVSTTEHLNRMSLVDDQPGQVRVEPGVRLGELLEFIGSHGLGFTNTPAIGEVTVGGMLAIAAHGSSVPTSGNPAGRDRSHGSISDHVVEIQVVAWDERRRQHRLLDIPRHDPEAAAVLTNLGRCFVTSVVLQAAQDVHLRCASSVAIDVDELLGAPERGGRSFQSFLEQSGGVEVIWFPFTGQPWLKTWTVEPHRPSDSRQTVAAYNYPFADRLPGPLTDIAAGAIVNRPDAAPLLGRAMRATVAAGLRATAGSDLWGPSRHLQLYTRPSAIRARMSGHAVLARRCDVQSIVHVFHSRFTSLIEEHRARGSHPVNMPVGIRATGLDHGAVTGRGSVVPTLSPLAPIADRPELDTAVWFNSLSLTGTPHLDAFWAELEAWLLRDLSELDVVVRPEWSKGWAYGLDGAWTDHAALSGWIPNSFGRANWDRAVTSLNALDPNGVFSNPFLDRLLAV